MDIEQIEVIIGFDGKVQLQASGFSGDACLASTEELELLLGNNIVKRERTEPVYEQNLSKSVEKIKIRN